MPVGRRSKHFTCKYREHTIGVAPLESSSSIQQRLEDTRPHEQRISKRTLLLCILNGMRCRSSLLLHLTSPAAATHMANTSSFPSCGLRAKPAGMPRLSLHNMKPNTCSNALKKIKNSNTKGPPSGFSSGPIDHCGLGLTRPLIM
jgi:hypothetical protein